MVAHTEIRPKCYTWSEKDFEEGGLQPKDEEYPFDIELSALSREALAYLQNKSTKVVSIVTDGNGACGVHAVFGTPSVRGTLFKDSSRELAVSLLGPNSEALQQARVDERYVAAISQSFWNEFVKPVLDRKPDSDSVEGLLFWKTLQKQKPALAEQCQQAHIQYGMVTQEHVDARQDLLNASHNFFTVDMELSFVRPLAIRRRYLPRGIDAFDIFDADNIANLREEDPLFDDWLGSASDDRGFIKASSPPRRFPVGGPCCKYLALFDLQPAYDGLRQLFLQGTTVFCEETQTILNCMLTENLESDNLPVDAVKSVIDLISEMHIYDKASLKLHETNAAPIDFVSQAWEVYLSCVHEPSYYFSVEEVMVMCQSAQVNIMLFREVDGRRLLLEDCSLQYDGAPIMVKIESKSQFRVRSHYERLIWLDELKHFDAALSAIRKRLGKLSENANPGARTIKSSHQDTNVVEPPPPCNSFPERKRRRLFQKTSMSEALSTKETGVSNILEKHLTIRSMSESEHPSAKLYAALSILKEHIREHPTLPPDPVDTNRPLQQAFNDKLALKLPKKHCAFKGCIWEGDNETARLVHLKDCHSELLESAARYLPSCFSTDVKYQSVYNESIAEKIREGAPLASYSLDRRALQNFDDALDNNNICAPMCFLCGCIYVHRSRPEHDVTTEYGFQNHIDWTKPFRDKDRFFNLSCAQTEEQYGHYTYLRKYKTDTGQFFDLNRHMQEFNDFVIDVPFTSGTVSILCCPEDRRCGDACRVGKTLCAECEVPICRTCYRYVYNKIPTQSPVAFANDMMIFYAPEELSKDDGLTVMEIICASPCITSMICFSLEVKYGNMLNTQALMHRHRVGARGNATTFPLPWEVLLRELQNIDTLDAASSSLQLPRTGKELQHVVQILLKTNDEKKV